MQSHYFLNPVKIKFSLLLLILVSLPYAHLHDRNKEGNMVAWAIGYLSLKKDNLDAPKRCLTLLEKHPAYRANSTEIQENKSFWRG
jgi:hypothetical protein